MSATARSKVQQAVYTLLSEDATLQGLVDRIGDSIPEGVVVSKAVVIGMAIESPDRTFGRNGHALILPIDSYAEDRIDQTGNRVVDAINDRVVALLDGAELVVEGHDAVLCHLEQTIGIPDPDPKSRHRRLVSEFRVIVEDAT